MNPKKILESKADELKNKSFDAIRKKGAKMVDADYAKRYKNATRKAIIHALTLAERKIERLKRQIKESKEQFTFLQSKLQNSFSLRKKERIRPELDESNQRL